MNHYVIIFSILFDLQTMLSIFKYKDPSAIIIVFYDKTRDAFGDISKNSDLSCNFAGHESLIFQFSFGKNHLLYLYLRSIKIARHAGCTNDRRVAYRDGYKGSKRITSQW